MCDLIGSILYGSEIYYNPYHNIVKTLFNGLEPFQLCPSKIIDHRDDVHRSHNPPVTPSRCNGNPAEQKVMNLQVQLPYSLILLSQVSTRCRSRKIHQIHSSIICKIQSTQVYMKSYENSFLSFTYHGHRFLDLAFQILQDYSSLSRLIDPILMHTPLLQ